MASSSCDGPPLAAALRASSTALSNPAITCRQPRHHSVSQPAAPGHALVSYLLPSPLTSGGAVLAGSLVKRRTTPSWQPVAISPFSSAATAHRPLGWSTRWISSCTTITSRRHQHAFRTHIHATAPAVVVSLVQPHLSPPDEGGGLLPHGRNVHAPPARQRHALVDEGRLPVSTRGHAHHRQRVAVQRPDPHGAVVGCGHEAEGGQQRQAADRACMHQ